MGIIDDKLKKYIDDVQPMKDGILGEIQKNAYERGVPIIPNDVAKLIEFIFSVTKPKKVLEIGMAIGFSSSLMAQLMGEDGHVTTIDRFDVMIDEAKENFRKLGNEDKITLIEGDAAKILPTLGEKYDVIFLDAAKGQYINFLPHCIRLLKVGGVMITDDILQNGTVADDIGNIERRQRTIHKRLRTFIEEITGNPYLTTSILTVGDGVALCRKNGEIPNGYLWKRGHGNEES
ncbi:MAG: O-methyltransferase [Firmicutes bacterium]|nr:O-methyltransferase [Bacillota bacterium]